jgi:hypothetical protein
MGHHDVGPIFIVQRTSANVLATPAFSVESDAFRCVIAGSGGGRQMGDARFQVGGTQWDEVVAGPQGMDEVVILADRRGVLDVALGGSHEWTSIVSATVSQLAGSMKKALLDA